MRFKNTHVGDKIIIDNTSYVVSKICRHFIYAIDLTTKKSNTFTFGDLVMVGIECGIPDR